MRRERNDGSFRKCELLAALNIISPVTVDDGNWNKPASYFPTHSIRDSRNPAQIRDNAAHVSWQPVLLMESRCEIATGRRSMRPSSQRRGAHLSPNSTKPLRANRSA